MDERKERTQERKNIEDAMEERRNRKKKEM